MTLIYLTVLKATIPKLTSMKYDLSQSTIIESTNFQRTKSKIDIFKFATWEFCIRNTSTKKFFYYNTFIRESLS